LVEEPAYLGAAEVRVQEQARALLEELCMARVDERSAPLGRTSVLPDDRAMKRLPRATIPKNGRLALVGDPNGSDISRRDLGLLQSRLARAQDAPPYFGGIVLDPPRLWIILGK